LQVLVESGQKIGPRGTLLPTLSIPCIESDKLGKQVNEFLDGFVGRRPGQNLFICLLGSVQPYLIPQLQRFVSISMMTA